MYLIMYLYKFLWNKASFFMKEHSRFNKHGSYCLHMAIPLAMQDSYSKCLQIPPWTRGICLRTNKETCHLIHTLTLYCKPLTLQAHSIFLLSPSQIFLRCVWKYCNNIFPRSEMTIQSGADVSRIVLAMNFIIEEGFTIQNVCEDNFSKLRMSVSSTLGSSVSLRDEFISEQTSITTLPLLLQLLFYVSTFTNQRFWLKVLLVISNLMVMGD